MHAHAHSHAHTHSLTDLPNTWPLFGTPRCEAASLQVARVIADSLLGLLLLLGKREMCRLLAI